MSRNIFCSGVYMNREYSWMLFNDRVLDQAEDESNPLLERCKFLSIFTSNLDEFYMVRVGSLYNQMMVSPSSKENKTKLTAAEQTEGILAETKPRYKRRAEIWRSLKKELKAAGVKVMGADELGEKQKKQAGEYFVAHILPYLSPLVIDAKHPMLRFANKSMCVVYDLNKGDKSMIGLLPVPEKLPRLIELSGGKKKSLIPLEELIRGFGAYCFPGYTVKDSALIRITRNADFETDESDVDSEYDYDFSKYLKDKIDMRASLDVVRLEINTASDKIKSFLIKNLGLKKSRCFTVADCLDYKFLFSLDRFFPPEVAPSLKYPPLKGRTPKSLDDGVMARAMKEDIFLSYPFDNMETTFVRLLNECAESDKVRSIKITIYRLSSRSKVVDALLKACENGKDVTVVIELLARFDEESNMYYANLLAEAGCTVIYGMGNYKVHSKIVSVVLEDGDKVRYITHLGTGNYNESTAKQYTDLNIITSDDKIGEDAVAFFRNIAIANVEYEYNRLLVAPETLKKGFSELIERETERAENGESARMIMKMNSLTDRELIEKLIAASKAGVKIDLIVRGICCLIPGVEGITENITVKSIVGRFLEHSRIYAFGDGDDAEIFISSADLMTRNIDKRVEIATPVLDRGIRKKIRGMLDLILADNVKGRYLTNRGKYVKKEIADGEELIDSQAAMLEKR